MSKFILISTQLILIAFALISTVTAQSSSVDLSFNASFSAGSSIRTLAIQADGRIIAGGSFTLVNGTSRNNIVRLNSDGSIDLTFDPGAGFNNTVEKVLIQADGKILVGGRFTSYNGIESNALVRLNSNGSLDTTFNANILGGTVLTIAFQRDTRTGDKILIGGSFNAVGGFTRNGFARLNSDGSLDSGFNPVFGNPQFGTVTIRSILAQDDGKVVVGGSFNGVNGFSRANLIRFNADGTVDTDFNAGNIGSVSLVEPYPGGKYLVTSAIGFVRLNNNGSIDNTFQPLNPNGTINAILVQPDRSIIIGGDFTSLGGLTRMRIARLRENGSVDIGFFPTGANDAVRALVRQADGRIIVGGDFSTINNVVEISIARLIIAQTGAQRTLFDFDGDGKADIAVFRPSNGFWYELRSQDNSFYSLQFGQASDLLAPADYDGDGRTDIAVFRETVPGAGDKSYFYIINSSDNAFRFAQLGTQGDLPISGDWDGDGIADLAVYRNASRADGQSFFFYRPSSQPDIDFRSIAWGTAGDRPVRGDFDGDGKLDAAVVRPSTATWYILQSSDNQTIEQQFGLPTDIPVPADYDGDTRTNIAVFRPSTGFWFTSTDPQTNFGAVQFGAAGDLPVPADYDGDGRADVAVYRPSNGVWYLLRSTAGVTTVQFGAAEDRPIPNVYIR